MKFWHQLREIVTYELRSPVTAYVVILSFLCLAVGLLLVALLARGLVYVMIGLAVATALVHLGHQLQALWRRLSLSFSRIGSSAPNAKTRV